VRRRSTGAAGWAARSAATIWASSSEALLEHGANMSEISAKVLETGVVEGELLGEPNAELRAKLTGPEPELFTPYLSLKPR
jgi:hypothetical protein